MDFRSRRSFEDGLPTTSKPMNLSKNRHSSKTTKLINFMIYFFIISGFAMLGYLYIYKPSMNNDNIIDLHHDIKRMNGYDANDRLRDISHKSLDIFEKDEDNKKEEEGEEEDDDDEEDEDKHDHHKHHKFLNVNEVSDFDKFDTVTHIVKCDTTKGDITIDIRKNWAPLGVPRFLELLNMDLFTNLPFFRVAPRYITQFGPKYNSNVIYKSIKDDPSLVGHRDMDFGYLFFAGSGQDSRDDQLVFSLCDHDGCHATGLGTAAWEGKYYYYIYYSYCNYYNL